MGKNDYDFILNLNAENSGLAYDYKGHNLRKGQMINKYSVPEYALNDDAVTVRCVECDNWMTYTHGFSRQLDGQWRCSKCGKMITELRVYKKIDEENDSDAERYGYY